MKQKGLEMYLRWCIPKALGKWSGRQKDQWKGTLGYTECRKQAGLHDTMLKRRSEWERSEKIKLKCI